MQKRLSVFLVSLFTTFSFLVLPVVAQPARDLGTVDVAGAGTIRVKVTGSTTELDQLANLAFNSHGRFSRVASGESVSIAFTAVNANQVRVDVRRGATAVTSQVVSGSSTRNALLRAADVAVKATTGLNGFFASRLAFISERTGKPEVYTGDLFFGEVKQITSDNAHAVTPRWSPDGRRLLYTSYFKSGFPDIFQIDLSTLQRTTFVSFKGTNSGARFSPDGSKVVMILSGEGNPEVYVSNAQGRQVSRLTRTTNAVESSPSFSPDGSQVIFTSDSAGGPQLYVMPASGGQPRRLATRVSGYCAEPDWNRVNPNKIAFTIRSGPGFQIAVYDMAGSEAAKVVSDRIGSRDVIEPSWLADGRHIICTVRAANQRALWIVDTETGKATRVSTPAMGQVSQASVLAP